MIWGEAVQAAHISIVSREAWAYDLHVLLSTHAAVKYCDQASAAENTLDGLRVWFWGSLFIILYSEIFYCLQICMIPH